MASEIKGVIYRFCSAPPGIHHMLPKDEFDKYFKNCVVNLESVNMLQMLATEQDFVKVKRGVYTGRVVCTKLWDASIPRQSTPNRCGCKDNSSAAKNTTVKFE